MNAGTLKLFKELQKVSTLEITCKLGIDQEVSNDTLEFIKYYRQTSKYTDPFDETLLQIIIWKDNLPITAFRESSLAQNERDIKSLYSFFYKALTYIKFITWFF